MGYKGSVIKGISWLALFRLITRVISFGRTAIVARLLSPAQFGLFGIATLILVFVETFTETGVNTVLLQEKDEVGEYIDSAWIVSILRGIFISSLIFLFSGVIAHFFNSPQAVTVIQLTSIVPLLRGLINPAVVKFQKDLTFHKEFYYRTSIFLVESIVSVILLFLYANPVALAWGMIGGALYELIASHLVVAQHPKFAFDKKKFTLIVSRGKWVTAAGIFSYIFSYGDNVAVGKILGSSVLGLYDMAYRISLLPITEVGELAAKVVFPIFVKFADDNRRLLRAYMKLTSILALLIISIGLLLIIFPEQIIIIVLGSKWLQAVPVLRVLTIFGVLRALMSPAGAVFLALKKQQYNTYSTLTSCVVLLITIVPFVFHFGLIGAGLSAVVATVVQVPVVCYLLVKVFSAENRTSGV